MDATTTDTSTSSTYGWDQDPNSSRIDGDHVAKTGSLYYKDTHYSPLPSPTITSTSLPPGAYNDLTATQADRSGASSSSLIVAKGEAVRGEPFAGSSILGGVFAVLVGGIVGTLAIIGCICMEQYTRLMFDGWGSM